MGRYDKEHRLVNLSPIPFVSLTARESVITDKQTGEQGRGLDWSSYREADAKAWDDLTEEE